MYPGDARSKWPDGLLTDQRVLHYWDQERVVRVRYLSNLAAMLAQRAPETVVPTADAMWDAFYVYARGARWQDPTPIPLSWGYPIMVTHNQLIADLEHLLQPPVAF